MMEFMVVARNNSCFRVITSTYSSIMIRSLGGPKKVHEEDIITLLHTTSSHSHIYSPWGSYDDFLLVRPGHPVVERSGTMMNNNSSSQICWDRNQLRGWTWKRWWLSSIILYTTTRGESTRRPNNCWDEYEFINSWFFTRAEELESRNQ